MEENKVEEVVEETTEDIEEFTPEVEESIEEEEVTDDSPTLEDFKGLEKKAKTLQAQKEHWRKKADEASKNKENKTENNLDEETLIRISKVASTIDDDDLEVLKTINGSSIAEKMENPMFKAYKAEKLRKKRSEQSALKPSGSATFKGSKDFNSPELSGEEHRKMFDKMISNN